MRRIAMAAIVIAAAGCATAPPPPPPPPPRVEPPGPPPPTLNRSWSLSSFPDAPVGEVVQAELTIGDGRAKGQVACQTFTALAPNAGVDLRFEQITPQSGACAMRPVDQQFLEALSAIRAAAIRHGYLVLIDGVGRERMYFAPR